MHTYEKQKYRIHLAMAEDTSAFPCILVRISLPIDCYLDVVGGLVPLRFEEGRPKAVRDKLAGKGQQQYY
jgi:hypothetical protein